MLLTGELQIDAKQNNTTKTIKKQNKTKQNKTKQKTKNEKKKPKPNQTKQKNPIKHKQTNKKQNKTKQKQKQTKFGEKIDSVLCMTSQSIPLISVLLKPFRNT